MIQGICMKRDVKETILELQIRMFGVLSDVKGLYSNDLRNVELSTSLYNADDDKSSSLISYLDSATKGERARTNSINREIISHLEDVTAENELANEISKPNQYQSRSKIEGLKRKVAMRAAERFRIEIGVTSLDRYR